MIRYSGSMFLLKLPSIHFIFFFILHHHVRFTSDSGQPTIYFFDIFPHFPVDIFSYHKNLASQQVGGSSISRLRIKAFGPKNAIATSVTFVLVSLSIIAYKLKQQHEDDVNKKLESSHLGHRCRLFSIQEIKSATNNFDDALVLGKGGFGKVYKGLIDGGATTVALKRLKSSSRQGAREFWTEIEMLSKCRHSHLVSLIGYCNEDPEMILVYEYMPHGTLSDHLYKNARDGTSVSNALSWEQRLKICIGAARGLDYLHTGTGVRDRVIHRDVKCSNILLDENWEAKISDFGLSKIGPANQVLSHVSTKVKGTFGYLDPEYLYTHKLTRKSDVYAFGVVLFVVLSGKPAIDFSVDEDQRALARVAPLHVKEGTIDQIVDPRLRGQISPDCLKVFGEIADQCLHSRPDKRPTMADVVARLEFALVSQESTEFSMEQYGILLATYGGEYNNEVNSHSSPGHENAVVVHNSGHLNDPSDVVGRPAGGLTSKLTIIPSTKKKSLKSMAIVTRVKKIWRKGKASRGELKQDNEMSTSIISGKIKDLEVTTNKHIAYEPMAKGSLDIWIFNKNEEDRLNWETRYKIALGTAKCLAHVHEGGSVKIVHGDINPSNVMLDDNFNPKLYNFNATTAVRCTPWYLPPEYINESHHHLSEKVDVYGFGVMLLEILCGERYFDITKSLERVDIGSYAFKKMEDGKLRDIVDSTIGDDDIVGRVSVSMKVAFWCMQEDPILRPTMTKVVQMLESRSPVLPPPVPCLWDPRPSVDITEDLIFNHFLDYLITSTY